MIEIWKFKHIHVTCTYEWVQANTDKHVTRQKCYTAFTQNLGVFFSDTTRTSQTTYRSSKTNKKLFRRHRIDVLIYTYMYSVHARYKVSLVNCTVRLQVWQQHARACSDSSGIINSSATTSIRSKPINIQLARSLRTGALTCSWRASTTKRPSSQWAGIVRTVWQPLLQRLSVVSRLLRSSSFVSPPADV